jgi:hypothetical protein
VARHAEERPEERHGERQGCDQDAREELIQSSPSAISTNGNASSIKAKVPRVKPRHRNDRSAPCRLATGSRIAAASASLPQATTTGETSATASLTKK